MLISTVYKCGKNAVRYDLKSDMEIITMSRYKLLNAIKYGLCVDNAYIRNESIVLKSRAGVKVKKYIPVIPVRHLDWNSEPCCVESYFDMYVLPEHLDNIVLKIIKEIDGAIPEKDVFKYGKFSTKFGVCGLEDLSSGCKTALWGYLKQKSGSKDCIPLTSAGMNALRVLFETLASFDTISVCFSFVCIPDNYDNEFEYDFLFYDIDRKKRETFLEFFIDYIEEDF